MTNKQNTILSILAAVLAIAALAATIALNLPALQDPIVTLGTTHFTAIEAEDITATDDLTVTDDSTFTDDVAVTGDLDATGATTLNSTLDVDGNLSSGTGAITMTDNALIDGQADAVQLTVQGYTTQTSNIFVVEESGATDLFWVTNNGDVEMNGTTPALTIGDAGTEDTSIIFDGQAQDFHIGLDDTADDLVLGVGTALGTTDALSIDENADLTVESDLTITNLLKPGFANLAVSDGDTITPTYTVYALDTSGAVTITLAASAAEGQLLILINDDANATVIADTNLRSSDGAKITLAGAYDIAVFLYQDSEWLEVCKSADS